MTDVTSQAIYSALFAGIRNVAAVIAAFLIIINFGGPFFKPWWMAQVNAVLQPFDEKITAQAALLDDISKRITRQPGPPFLELIGVGLIPEKGPFYAGDYIKAVYMTRRNKSCPTTIEARFLDVSGQIDSTHTYFFTATRAPITQLPAPFSPRILLPTTLAEGRWSVSVVIEADRIACPDEVMIVPTPTEYFDVIRRN